MGTGIVSSRSGDGRVDGGQSNLESDPALSAPRSVRTLFPARGCGGYLLASTALGRWHLCERRAEAICAM
jgi:hypothetical protein